MYGDTLSSSFTSINNMEPSSKDMFNQTQASLGELQASLATVITCEFFLVTFSAPSTPSTATNPSWFVRSVVIADSRSLTPLAMTVAAFLVTPTSTKKSTNSLDLKAVEKAIGRGPSNGNERVAQILLALGAHRRSTARNMTQRALTCPRSLHEPAAAAGVK